MTPTIVAVLQSLAKLAAQVPRTPFVIHKLTAILFGAQQLGFNSQGRFWAYQFLPVPSLIAKSNAKPDR